MSRCGATPSDEVIRFLKAVAWRGDLLGKILLPARDAVEEAISSG